MDTNLLIEVNGDCWHCNPKVYAKPINAYQEWAMRRDFAKSLGYKVYTIWEYDIKTEFEKVKTHLERKIDECKV